MGESLALFTGFLELDPNHPGHTRIVAHNAIWVDMGDETRARFEVRRLDRRHVGISDKDFQLGGVRLSLNVCANHFNHMLNKRVLLDMGAWIQDTTILSPLLPYAQ